MATDRITKQRTMPVVDLLGEKYDTEFELITLSSLINYKMINSSHMIGK